MEKKIIFILFIFLIISSSCDKKNEAMDNQIIDSGEVSIEEYATKVGGSVGWSVTFSAGHDNQYPIPCCGYFNPGSGMTIMPHIPCTGDGDNCTHTISVSINIKNSEVSINEYYNGTVTFISEDFKDEFNISSKSIEVLDEKDVLYINIPEQIMLQNIDSDSFTAINISFTRQPIC